MKTLITLEVTHKDEIPNLADLIAGRAYTISGVANVENVEPGDAMQVAELVSAGFSLAEISLGQGEVHRT